MLSFFVHCSQLCFFFTENWYFLFRDAWTFGATDPNSGTAVLLEVARAFGNLSQNGWKPKRSIRICSWDGEEYGLLGSTAYAGKFYFFKMFSVFVVNLNVDFCLLLQTVILISLNKMLLRIWMWIWLLLEHILTHGHLIHWTGKKANHLFLFLTDYPVLPLSSFQLFWLINLFVVCWNQWQILLKIPLDSLFPKIGMKTLAL